MLKKWQSADLVIALPHYSIHIKECDETPIVRI